jgi:outer membrane biosynthesis protein TonB
MPPSQGKGLDRNLRSRADSCETSSPQGRCKLYHSYDDLFIMRFPSSFRHPVSLAAAVILLGAAAPLRADDHVVYYAEPTERPGFFHRVSDFFKDLFATEQDPGPRATPPQPTAPRYNLDLPPPGTGYGYGANYKEHSSVTTTEQSTVNTYGSRPAKKKPKHPSPEVASSEPAHKPPVEKSKPEPAPKKKHAPSYVESDPAPSTSTESTEPARNTSITPKAPSETKNVPTGSRTSKSSRVKSPYPPYNELDVSGLSSGSLAMDPTTQKVFRVP